MTTDEVNENLFDEIKLLQKENQYLKEKESFIYDSIKTLLDESNKQLKGLDSGNVRTLTSRDFENQKVGLVVRVGTLSEIIGLFGNKDNNNSQITDTKPTGQGLTKEDLAKMSMEEINELMDKAIQKGHLQFLREL